MAKENENKEELKEEITQLAQASLLLSTNPNSRFEPWRTTDYEKADSAEIVKDYQKVVNSCRFFYRKDPLANTTIDKLVELGTTDIVVDQGSLSDNQYRILQGIKEDVLEFIKRGVLEFLISGLVVPEINYDYVKKNEIERMGVKKYKKLWLPTEMWYRNPEHIEIKESFFSSEPFYYLKIPNEYIQILKELDKKDTPKVIDIKNRLRTSYPNFFEKLKNHTGMGSAKILLDNDLIIRRKPSVDMPFPMPYLYPALEALKHKRNMRAMDYALASRVIEAIQVFRLGDEDFPLTEENKGMLDDLKDQIRNRRAMSPATIEKVYQLFSNHTLDIEWIMPPMEALLSQDKYQAVNNDIVYALGFPRILIMGEAKRTGASNHDFAILSPQATMESFRKRFIRLAREIFDTVVRKNDLGDYGGVRFKPINLVKFKDFSESLVEMYSKGNISRQSASSYYGYNWEEEARKRAEEKELLNDLGIEGYEEQPFDKKNDTIPGKNDQESDEND